MSEPLPTHMRALILREPNVLALERLPIPTPGPGEILVRVRAATTCGTDLKAFRRGHPQIPMPGPFGHEYSGDVVAAGEGAPYGVGDAVMGVHSAPCQACFWCSNDQENLCESIMATKVLGSFAEYLLVPERIARLNVFAKPPALSYAKASLLEPLACVAQGVSLLPIRPDSTALVIGPGAIGLMFVAALLRQGAQSVTLAGRNPLRLAVGEQLGATAIPAEDLGYQTYDLVIECTGQVEVWERSLFSVRRGGTLMLFGGPPAGTKAALDTKKLHYDQITVLSPFHFGTRAVRQAYDWLTGPGFDLSPMLSGVRTLEEGEATFADLQAGRGIKYVFQP